MEGYLGETETRIKCTPYKDFTPSDFALLFIDMYGYIDGAHHKDELLKDVAMILNGVEVIISIAKWDNGHSEYRFELGDENEKYIEWRGEEEDEW